MMHDTNMNQFFFSPVTKLAFVLKDLVILGLRKVLHEGLLSGGVNDSKPVEGFSREWLDPLCLL